MLWKIIRQTTGLANRYRLTNDSEKIVVKCFVEHSPLLFEILDIDYFKQYNERYGHQTGDDCVRVSAALIGRWKRIRFSARTTAEMNLSSFTME